MTFLEFQQYLESIPGVVFRWNDMFRVHCTVFGYMLKFGIHSYTDETSPYWCDIDDCFRNHQGIRPSYQEMHDNIEQMLAAYQEQLQSSDVSGILTI